MADGLDRQADDLELAGGRSGVGVAVGAKAPGKRETVAERMERERIEGNERAARRIAETQRRYLGNRTREPDARSSVVVSTVIQNSPTYGHRKFPH